MLGYLIPRCTEWEDNNQEKKKKKRDGSQTKKGKCLLRMQPNHHPSKYILV
jgi:hypothetical protein